MKTQTKSSRITIASTSMFIAVAAFAVTLTSVQAFGNPEFLIKAGLSDEQAVAIQEARELRKNGDISAARDTMIAAGIDDSVISELRQAHREYRHEHKKERREAARELLSDDQREALQVAHEANDKEAVRAIFAEVGIELPERGKGQN